MTRKRVLENLKNVFWAFVFAVALWLVMVQSEQTTLPAKAVLLVTPPAGAEVSVRYLTPDGAPPKVDVMLRGSPNDLGRIVDGDLVRGTLDVPEQPLGRRNYPASSFNFHLPAGVVVDKSLLREEVGVELAKLKRDWLEVKLDTGDSKMPAGWEIASKDIEPPSMEAAGPADEMEKAPALRTQPLILPDDLERQGFDPAQKEPQSVRRSLGVLPPKNSGIKVTEERKSVTVRIVVRPKPLERVIPISPSFLFPGPAFPGFPYRLDPFPVTLDTVKVKVSGPEEDLLDAAIDATRAKFLVLVVPPKDRLGDLMTGKIPMGTRLLFDVKVVPPQGLKVLGVEPDKINFAIAPLRPEATIGGGER